MADQFGRKVIVELGDVKWTSTLEEPGLRVSFAIERDKSVIPNSAELSIWGLSKDTRGELEKAESTVCRITAGYSDEAGQIFHGYVNDVEVEHAPPEWVTRVSAGDAQDKYNNSKVNLSVAKGTSVYDVLKKLVGAVGVGTGNLPSLVFADLKLPSGETKLAQGMGFVGSAVFELQSFATSIGLDWSIQDGQFVAALNGEPYNEEGPLLTPETGLIGTVKIGKKGIISGVCLLHPKMLPGTAFRVESAKVTGDYIASWTRHVGDNYDEKSWITEWSALPLGSTSEALFPDKKEDEGIL